MIELQGLTKRYHETVALHDVTLHIAARERLMICGHSGCGKTTLLRLIAGLEKPDCGEIRLNKKIASAPEILIAPEQRNIAMVFQDLALWPHMTVEQNIGFGLEGAIKDRDARREAVDAILRLLHLEGKGASYPSTLSGGEQQRVALGRAIIRKPAILLMDEPLAHVDDDLRDILARLILEIQSQFGITLVYVTHDRDLAKLLAGSIALMSKGRIEKVERHHG